MQKIIGAKKLGRRDLEFFVSNIELNIGDKIVVEIEDFQTIVQVCEIDVNISITPEDLGKVLRIATNSDLSKYEKLIKKAKDELPKFKKKSLELGLIMKFVTAEYSLDMSKILIVFSSEDRVDFRQFLKDLASMLKTRIELKQIGQRDEVKMIGGVGPCGQPCCCARFLKDFEHVTVKMAKIQALSLSPTKINGVCGRLMCCLGYETKFYEEQLSKMPKINSEVETPNGVGTVVYNDILRERVSVKRKAEGDTIVVEEFELEQLKGFASKKQKETTEKIQEERVSHDEKNFEKKNKDAMFAEKNVQDDSFDSAEESDRVNKKAVIENEKNQNLNLDRKNDKFRNKKFNHKGKKFNKNDKR